MKDDDPTRRPAGGGAKKRRKKRPGWLLRTEYVLLRLVLGGLGLLPLPLAYWIAEQILRVVYLLVPRFRKRTLKHLEMAYGDEHDEAWRRDLLRRNRQSLAWYFVDMLLAPKLLRKERYANAVDASELVEVLEREGALERTGCLIISAHQGTPEIVSLAIAAHGWPNTVVARVLDNPLIWGYLMRERESFDRPLVSKHGALRQGFRTLRDKGIFALQVDQDTRGANIWVPYFGRLARTHHSGAGMALRSGVPTVVAYGIRTEPRRFRYKLFCHGPLEMEPSGDRDTDIVRLTALAVEHLERMARRYPEQVMWAHRRWKTPPPDDVKQAWADGEYD